LSEVLVNPYRYAVDGFSPTDISDLYVWYDASDETTITKDVSDRISKWENKEGTTERDLIQDTSDDQPLWISADQNGKDVIDLVDDRYFATASALSAVSQPFTIYNVQEMANTNCHLLDGHGASNRINYPHTYTTDRWRCWLGSGLDTITISGLTGSVAQTATLANTTATKLRTNKAEVGSGNTGSGSLAGLTVGVNTTVHANVFWNHKVMEIIMYDKLLTSVEYDQVETYLEDKWGL
jgi:hypothetical protein